MDCIEEDVGAAEVRQAVARTGLAAILLFVGFDKGLDARRPRFICQVLREVNVKHAVHVVRTNGIDRFLQGITTTRADHGLRRKTGFLHLTEEQHGIVLIGGLQHHINLGTFQPQNQ